MIYQDMQNAKLILYADDINILVDDKDKKYLNLKVQEQ